MIPEAALEIIKELRARHAAQAPWSDTYPGEFQTLIARRQARNESAARDCHATAENVVFLDRGLIDGLAYCRLRNEPVTPELAQIITTATYDQVFLLDLIHPFDGRHNTGRSSDEVVALKLHEMLRETWSQFGLPPVRVPVMPLSDRLAFILERV